MGAEIRLGRMAREGGARLRAASGSIGKNALAAGAAWFIATEALGHRQAFSPDCGDRLPGDHRRRAHAARDRAVNRRDARHPRRRPARARHGRGTVSLIVVVAFAMSAAVFVGGGNLLVRQSATLGRARRDAGHDRQPVHTQRGRARRLRRRARDQPPRLPRQPTRDPAPRGRPVLTELAGVLDDATPRAARARPRSRGGGDRPGTGAGAAHGALPRRRGRR